MSGNFDFLYMEIRPLLIFAEVLFFSKKTTFLQYANKKSFKSNHLIQS